MDELGRELRFHLLRLGRRLRWRDGWLLAQRSLWLACLAAILIQLGGRLWPLERLWLWTLAPLAAWLLAVGVVSLLRPMPPMRVARRVDAELDLKERLATSLELAGWLAGWMDGWKDDHHSPISHPSSQPASHPSIQPSFHPSLVALQRQDALDAIRPIHPRRAFPLRWLRRPMGLAALFAVGVLALTLLPNPMDAVLAERAAVAQAAEEQAAQVERLREEIESAQELTPEVREELLRQLEDLAQQLRANPGDRAEALADLSRVEESLRRQLDPNADARRAAMEAMAAQLQGLSQTDTGQQGDLAEAGEALEQLAERLEQMDAGEREALAQSLAQMAARAAQAGHGDLAQQLAALSQAARSGEGGAGRQAARAAADALSQAEGELAEQTALQRALSGLEESRRTLAEAGQGQGLAQGQGQGQGQAQGQGQSQGQPAPAPPSGPGGQAQGQGQGQPGGGGGTKADTLPPARRSGRADRPQGEGPPASLGELDRQVYVPWERRPGSGEEISIPGQDTGQGETQVREQEDPLPGAPGQALVPYSQVYQEYLDSANQTMERGYIPPGLKDYVRDYFSQLEP